jgi:hypothetical protein
MVGAALDLVHRRLAARCPSRAAKRVPPSAPLCSRSLSRAGRSIVNSSTTVGMPVGEGAVSQIFMWICVLPRGAFGSTSKLANPHACILSRVPTQVASSTTSTDARCGRERPLGVGACGPMSVISSH